jgi:glycerol-1-phosphate dehydrogenase [NAD(P)+]
MKQDIMTSILNGTIIDPDVGLPLSVPTRSVFLQDDLRGMEQDLISGLELGKCLAVVSDHTTREILGRQVERALESIAQIISIVLPHRPHADMETVKKLQRACSMADGLIAVGSGTINDLCKYAAYLDGKPYAVFGTAPSMNGYTSVSASINEKGFKKSLPAAGARGVFLDLTVLSKAPKRMIRSGLGDSLCRSTAQADWLLAHLLFQQPYREIPFTLLAEDEEGLLAEPEALLAGDLTAMKRLARTLVLSGFGMTICGGSYPASQGEHLISHYAEMMGSPQWPESFHGEQIGVCTLTMSRIQERLLTEDTPRVKPNLLCERDMLHHFGIELGVECWREFSQKKLDATAADALNSLLRKDWKKIQERIVSIIHPVQTLRDALFQAGAPLTPEDLHWPRLFYLEAVGHAREIRHRYTFLDFAADCGLLETVAHI